MAVVSLKRLAWTIRTIAALLPRNGCEISFAALEVGTIERRHTPAHRIAVRKPHRLDVRPHDGVAGQRTMMAQRHRAARDVGREVPQRLNRVLHDGPRHHSARLARPAILEARGTEVRLIGSHDIELPDAI